MDIAVTKNLILTISLLIIFTFNIYTFFNLKTQSEEVTKLSSSLQSLPDCVPIYNNDITLKLDSTPSPTTIIQQVHPCLDESTPLKGSRGSSGKDGTVGPKGDKGDLGEEGPSGLPGDKGDKGDRGDKGDKGDRGDKGNDGSIGPSGPAGTLSLTYGSFFDTSLQSNPVANVARSVRYNSVAEADGISIVEGSKIKISKTGVYNFQFSIQIYKTDGGTDTMDFWLIKNNQIVDDTNTRMTLIDKNYYAVAAWNYVVSGTSGDEFELNWSSADTAASLYTSGPFTNPIRPRIPAVILTVTQIK